jgi:thiol-disulfide isomerase/thioredoxin
MDRRIESTAFHMLAVVIACLGWVALAAADQAPEFPADPNAWINSGPLSVSGLKGKGIVLYFFEEEDAATRNRWPELIEASKKYDGKPVVFIAVNSGNPKAKVQGYMQQIKVPWPVLVDTSRDFEKACGLFNEISPQNVSQIRYIKPDGDMQVGLNDDMEDIADKASEGAEWKIDPSQIPDALKSTWMAVEIGNYKGIAANLKKSTTSSKADVKEAAAKLMELVQKEIDDLMAKIKEAQDAENPYRAFELTNEVSDRFTGFELPKDVATLKKDLTASKGLELARKQLTLGNAAAKAKSKASLEKIVTDFPDTTLATQAKALLEYSE